MDAAEAARKVKAFFEEVNGTFGVIQFRLESVEQVDADWIVVCSFIPSISANARDRYQVNVGKDGSIGAVKSLGTATRQLGT